MYFQLRLHYKFGPIVRLLAYGRLNWLRPRFYWNLLRSGTSETFHDELSHDVRFGGQQILFCYCGYNIFLDTRWVILILKIRNYCAIKAFIFLLLLFNILLANFAKEIWKVLGLLRDFLIDGRCISTFFFFWKILKVEII